MNPATKKIKCVLEPHYRIPPPILMILMGNLPQVSSSIEDVTDESIEESQIIKAPKEDGWNKVGLDEVDEEPVPSAADIITRSPSPNIPISNTYLISASAGGQSIVLAYKTKFVMVQLNNEGEYSALGQGSGCEQPGEEITSILCLPLFVPSTRLTQNYIMCGYNTGWIRVFSDAGVLLTEQQLELTPVLSIKIRTPPPVIKTGTHHSINQNEDITILFRSNRVVSIDGQSLWMVLRVCDGQRESGIDASRSHTAFTYKKWDLQHQDEIKDIISLGPSPSYSITTPFIDPSNTISTNANFPPKNATARYIAVGSHPMLTYYATSESSRPLSAAAMASYVVSRVTSPVFSFAKSWWASTPSQGTRKSNTPTPYVPDMHRPPNHIEPATLISSVLSINDAYRKINQISISPPSTSALHHPLAATSDALGRVILWDLHAGEMIRIWKGVRDAVCGWVEVFEHELYQFESMYSPPKILLFLVIYSSKRGFLKVFQMRHGKQVGAYHVGSGWQLVPCAREPLGSSMVTPAVRKKSPNGEYGGLSNCLLVGPDGEVRKIKITLRDLVVPVVQVETPMEIDDEEEDDEEEKPVLVDGNEF
ncbi:Rab3 GTPase-activating protein regulatory subunit N-terminus-domain-containing protein [Pilaira anomala]|nr:Rab3 GTPase-activating protein regulatory subunit N-terminus-domain-containing protein [Pilaira anomala]